MWRAREAASGLSGLRLLQRPASGDCGSPRVRIALLERRGDSEPLRSFYL